MADPASAQQLRDLERRARDLGRQIADGLPKGIGFFLGMFDFGPSGWSTYMSNGQRADMVDYLRDLADRLERNEPPPRESGYSRG